MVGQEREKTKRQKKIESIPSRVRLIFHSFPSHGGILCTALVNEQPIYSASIRPVSFWIGMRVKRLKGETSECSAYSDTNSVIVCVPRKNVTLCAYGLWSPPVRLRPHQTVESLDVWHVIDTNHCFLLTNEQKSLKS